MEFLLIGESKLKVVLNNEEAKKYCLNSGGADCSGGEVRRAFWRVLDLAKEEVGFDPAGDKVLIQMYPLTNGGCELFVTKLGILPTSSARLISRSDRVALLSKKQSYYVFDSVDEIIDCARAIKSLCRDFSPKSDIYYADSKYYLAIEEFGKGGEPIEFPTILEFGRALIPSSVAYITEHAKRLTDGDGIEKFAELK